MIRYNYSGFDGGTCSSSTILSSEGTIILCDSVTKSTKMYRSNSTWPSCVIKYTVDAADTTDATSWVAASETTKITYVRRLINTTEFASEGLLECTYPDSLSQMEYEFFDSGKSRLVPKTPGQRLREIIQHRQAPAFIGYKNRQAVSPTKDIKEICARETLRKVLGENGYRTFIRNGFVSVRPKSGMVYQIFPSHGITNVYLNGEKIERLCVVLKGDFPPTDSLIMRYLLILNDEQGFRKLAIKHHVIAGNKSRENVVANEPLPTIYRRLKLVG